MRLRRVDIEAILGFLADLDHLDEDVPVGPGVLDLLNGLIPSDAVSFQDADLASRRFVTIAPPEAPDEDDLYWKVGPCPIAAYRTRTLDLAAVRMSDVIGRQRYHSLPIYAEYFRLGGVEHVLDLGLAARPDRYRSVVLLRGREAGEFSERDRDVLETLRPHLRARGARAELRLRLSAPDPMTGAEAPPTLTRREREVVRLVSEGRTNGEIAVELCVSPATVKKHLENVYLKLGVTGRAAAAAQFMVAS